MSEPTKRIAFWIDPVSIGRSIGNKCNLFSASDMPSDRNWIPVIEYVHYTALEAQLAQAERTIEQLQFEKSAYNPCSLHAHIHAKEIEAERDQLKAERDEIKACELLVISELRATSKQLAAWRGEASRLAGVLKFYASFSNWAFDKMLTDDFDNNRGGVMDGPVESGKRARQALAEHETFREKMK